MNSLPRPGIDGSAGQGAADLPMPPESEVALRKSFLMFTAVDEALIQEVDAVISSRTEQLIDGLYDHFLRFEETRSFFPDEATLHRAMSAQRQYFARLTKGNYGQEYVRDRLRVGNTHYRIDLDPKWYLGAYNWVLTWIINALMEEFSTDVQKLASCMHAIRKLIFFDMSLAIDTYIAAKERAIRQHASSISQLEAERRVTKSILEYAPIGIVRLSNEFICLECNQEFVNIVDASSRDQVMGKSLFEVSPFLSPQPFEEVLQSGWPNRKTADVLHLSALPSKSRTYWDWAIWPVTDDHGNPIGLVAKFINATDRVLLQQQREDFVATLTHDLKTPILAANRALKLLMEGDFGPVDENQVQVLQTIHESNEALYKLVLTLLDVYRYESGVKKLSYRLHDLNETVARIVAELQPLARQQEIEIEAQLPPTPTVVLGDPDELRRVIQNLLDNSLKFTPPAGRIVVKIAQSAAETTVSVADTGKGISKEDKPKLFQRFWQAASTGRYYASTGLGLYLCRKIVELHQGHIACESEVGKGSIFTFTIANMTQSQEAESPSGV